MRIQDASDIFYKTMKGQWLKFYIEHQAAKARVKFARKQQGHFKASRQE
jgi:hypothetical protein